MAHNNVAILGCSYSIEPGLASIKGSVEQNRFELVGENNAYFEHKVSRIITGELSRLEIKGADMVEYLGPKAKVKKSYLIFHLGEGVTVKVVGTTVLLIHADSRYWIKLECSIGKPEVYSGWDEEFVFKSVAGAGFMQINDTSTVVFQIPSGQSCQWKLTVDEKSLNY